MTSETNVNLKEILSELAVLAEEASREYEKSSNDFWNSLSKDDQMKAFYSVVSRIYKGDVQESRSFRGVLYGVFEFGPESYVIGMESGYMTIHNMLCEFPESSK
jgi:hypothetical protein